MKMTYTSDFKTNDSTSTLDIYTWNGNSIYDPDGAYGGDSDRGFTQMMTLYDRYVVTGSSIKVTAVNISGYVRTIAVFPSFQPVGSYLSMYYNGIKGQPYCTMRDLTPLNGSKSIAYMKNYMTTAKVFGLPKLTTTAITTYSGTATSNPTGVGQWFWYLAFLKTDITPNMGVQFKVEMTHYVKFFQRKVTPL